MHRPDLVIFDCDGVLVDSELISNEVLARLLTAAGLPTTTAQALRDYQGLIMGDVVGRAEGRLGGPLPADFVERFERARAEQFRTRLRPVPGAAEAIAALRAAGVAVCVASQGKLSKTELTLGLTGLRSLFEDHALFSAHAVARGKPFPDLFLHAAATMGAAPERSVVVEDTPSGARAGVAAGMRVLGYSAGADGQGLRAAGAEPLPSMGELPGRLGV